MNWDELHLWVCMSDKGKRVSGGRKVDGQRVRTQQALAAGRAGERAV